MDISDDRKSCHFQLENINSEDFGQWTCVAYENIQEGIAFPIELIPELVSEKWEEILGCPKSVSLNQPVTI